MPDVELPGWVLWIVAAGAIAGALTQVGKAMRSVAGWLGGIVRREVTEIVDARLAPLYAEFKPNGGASLRDGMDDLSAWAARHAPEEWAEVQQDRQWRRDQ